MAGPDVTDPPPADLPSSQAYHCTYRLGKRTKTRPKCSTPTAMVLIRTRDGMRGLFGPGGDAPKACPMAAVFASASVEITQRPAYRSLLRTEGRRGHPIHRYEVCSPAPRRYTGPDRLPRETARRIPMVDTRQPGIRGRGRRRPTSRPGWNAEVSPCPGVGAAADGGWTSSPATQLPGPHRPDTPDTVQTTASGPADSVCRVALQSMPAPV